MNPLEEKKPSCEMRKPTLRGASCGTGGSIRRSSLSSVTDRRSEGSSGKDLGSLRKDYTAKLFML
jgi:hypothetical protein